MKYALDADHNLVPGDDLTFAYMGSGVATFIDKDGTGFRIPIGTRNLAGVVKVEGVEVPVLESDAVFSVLASEEDASPANVVENWNTSTLYTDLTNRALEALCHDRGIEFKRHPNKEDLIALLEDAD